MNKLWREVEVVKNSIDEKYNVNIAGDISELLINNNNVIDSNVKSLIREHCAQYDMSNDHVDYLITSINEDLAYDECRG